MQIEFIEATDIRNFQNFNLNPAATINFFYGENGSGKTSILEAIYLLSVGKSFRTHLSNRIINQQSKKLSIFSRVIKQDGYQIPVGIEKSIKGETKIRICGEDATVVESAKLLPIQVLNNDSFSLITDGPKPRRQFLDWGLFHVKHQFMEHWRSFQYALYQRNSALKKRLAKKQIQSWDPPLIHSAEKITDMRREYVSDFIQLLNEVLGLVFPSYRLSFQFYQGWPEDTDIKSLYNEFYQKDLELGYSYYGPQRADLIICKDNTPVKEVLSRGQQKILAWVMKVSQGSLLQKITEKKGIYLVDDLPSELDISHRQSMMELLREMKVQLFITAIARNSISPWIVNEDYKMFHVKHGRVDEA